MIRMSRPRRLESLDTTAPVSTGTAQPPDVSTLVITHFFALADALFDRVAARETLFSSRAKI
jgi:hypothetical protein